MAFEPAVLHPSPDPSIVRALRQIDPDLRLVWGYDRYLRHRWAIERKIPTARYHEMYQHFLASGEERFIEQPIYDDDQPIYDEWGDVIDHAIVGYRKYDLAPDYEHVQFIEAPDGGFRHPNMRDVLELKRVYAWERFHSLSRARFEKQQLEDAKDAAFRKETADMLIDAVDEAWSETGVRVRGRQPEAVFAGTEL